MKIKKRLTLVIGLLLAAIIVGGVVFIGPVNVSQKSNTYDMDNNPTISNSVESVNVPILMYHHISEDPTLYNGAIISPEKFEQDMIALKEAGFNTVTLQDLVDFVYNGKSLPEKPVHISFDDGYLSNYEYAYPVLKKLNMKASIYIIGWSIGLDKHRIEGEKFYPHFSFAQAKEMIDSGVIEIQNHSYDMHGGNETGRVGSTRLPDESVGDYARAFIADVEKNDHVIEQNLSNQVFAYSYPLGYYSLQSEQLLKDLGYLVSLSTDPGINTIERGNPSSLFALKRINAGSEIPSKKLVEMME